MDIIGPRDWSCTGTFGADGGGGVTVYPAGSTSASAKAISASQTSACVGCALGQTCPLFAAALAAYERTFNQGCPTYKPSFETERPIGAGLVQFEDPPRITGDGVPSGGPYRAIGVMTFHPDSPDGSWLETCTLPPSDQVLCAVSLHQFVAQYGTY
jgi:hypothetical protein